MADRAYLDWNATAPLNEAARAAVLAALDAGNPSSVHAEGRDARVIVERARAEIAAAIGAAPRQIVFTSGATEANALALTPAIETADGAAPRDGLVVSAIEHPSVRRGHRFGALPVETAAVDRAGVVQAAAIADALERLAARGVSRPLVSVMLANNETGVIQPIAAIADTVHAAGGLVHVDAVQALGRIPLDVRTLDADLVTLSSHKAGGPKGAGALVLGSRIRHLAAPLIAGGGQERGVRAGTEAVPAIAGFGAAAAAAVASLPAAAVRMAGLRRRLADGLHRIAPSAVELGSDAPRLPNTLALALAGLAAETAVIAFDLNGVAISAGSACSSGKVAASPVVAAMGWPELAGSTLRFSIGPATTEADIDRAIGVWQTVVGALANRRGKAA
ncbi:cysteine desulfurase family protein [Blastochloris sulfoviridis]|uniref:Cysteine desulfurase n=1 Tax=Blastochloris sulfoviridis TaxID=50712 RepID=A0A5M6I0K4_9HYPH|nr:cysteine desulfurase family protein [Blastochloris sulfoviridis]KAA5601706.1 cysteine desulfurase [Blastochloris sulfoviridis]